MVTVYIILSIALSVICIVLRVLLPGNYKYFPGGLGYVVFCIIYLVTNKASIFERNPFSIVCLILNVGFGVFVGYFFYTQITTLKKGVTSKQVNSILRYQMETKSEYLMKSSFKNLFKFLFKTRPASRFQSINNISLSY